MIKKKFSHILSFFLLLLLVVVPFAEYFSPVIASASTSTCTLENTVMSVVAHEDDDLLFQNPDLSHIIQSGKCVQTVFVTAGDAGAVASYWLGREDGAKAAYAQMAGVSNVWDQSDAGIPGHMIPVFTLVGNTKVSLAFLRLPDGNMDGSGFNGNGSLQDLWAGSISTLTAIDNSSSYTRDDVINTLLALMNNYQPSRINTQDYMGTFEDGDHSDHHTVAYFTKSAHNLYTTPHTIYAYRGYSISLDPANIFDPDLTSKVNTFFTYTPFDAYVCQSYEACSGPYVDWLNRQYVGASETGGIVDSCPNLDGFQTVVPNGYQLVGGQCVVKPEICESVVSDTGDMVATDTPAVPTFISPLWTAGPNIPGATWIWNAFHVTDPANGETVIFTKQISITGTSTSASIVIAADDNYEASLNGTQFATVGDVNNYSAGNEDIYDVSALLHGGSNTLVITVHNLATGSTNPELNPAGLRYKLDIVKSSCDAPDITPPSITNATSTSITQTGATVLWNTDEPATSLVEYGTSTSYGSSTTLDSSLVTAHSVALSGLEAGMLYHYRVTSSDTALNATSSDDNVFTTTAGTTTPPDITPPGITNATSTFITQTGATILWNTNEPATSQVEFGTSTSYGTSTALNSSLDTSHSVILSGLEAGMLYHYRVTSSDAASNATSSDDNFFTTTSGTTTPPDTTPPSITNATSTSITQTGATVLWNTDEPATSLVEYGTSTTYGNSTTLDSSLVTAHSIVLSGLEAGTFYHYRVTSSDAASNATSSTDKVFTTATVQDTTPPGITNASSTAITQTGATILWSTDEPATSQVEYGTSTSYGNTTTLDSLLLTSHSVALSGLTAGTLYHFRVKSSDAALNAASSTDKVFTTTAGTTTPPDTIPPAFSAVTTNSSQSVSSVTYSHTIGSTETNRLLVVGASVYDWTTAGNRVITSVTYNGVALTKARSDDNTSTGGRSEVWYLLNPAVGAHNVVITLAGPVTNIDSYTASFTGVKQSGQPIASNGANTSGTTNHTVSLTTTTANSLIIDALNGDAGPFSLGSGQTTLMNFNGSTGRGSYKIAPSVGAYPMTETTTANDGAAHTAVVFGGTAI